MLKLEKKILQVQWLNFSLEELKVVLKFLITLSKKIFWKIWYNQTQPIYQIIKANHFQFLIQKTNYWYKNLVGVNLISKCKFPATRNLVLSKIFKSIIKWINRINKKDLRVDKLLVMKHPNNLRWINNKLNNKMDLWVKETILDKLQHQYKIQEGRAQEKSKPVQLM